MADHVFQGSIAQVYEAVLGPFMFAPFARDMASRLSGFDGEVLEIAAGTGVLTRELDRNLGPRARIMATDLNPPMLDLAAAALRSPRVEWRQADALMLPFESQRFDAVVCQFGVMFYPDQTAAHRQAARVLRPSGRYIMSVWDDLLSNPVAETVHLAAASFFPDDPPEFLARTPHGHHDTARLCEALGAAAFRDISVETVTLDAGLLNAEDLAFGFCQGTPLRNEIEARGGDLQAATAAVQHSLRARFGGGPIESTIRAHVLTAVK